MDTTKLRWIVAFVFIVVGAALVWTGHLSGEQWANTVGGILTGSGATLATAPKQ